jgi:hypothetical protein
MKVSTETVFSETASIGIVSGTLFGEVALFAGSILWIIQCVPVWKFLSKNASIVPGGRSVRVGIGVSGGCRGGCGG